VNGRYPQHQITVLHGPADDAASVRLDLQIESKHGALVAQMFGRGPLCPCRPAEPFYVWSACWPITTRFDSSRVVHGWWGTPP